MPDVPVADAMEEARAVLDAEQSVDAWGLGPDEPPARENTLVTPEETAAAEASAPVQVPLFEPPPFDFEQAYDELHRLDLRAKNRKSAWESLKAASRDAKEDYDSAINDLHDKFDEIDSARRVAAAVQQKPHASNATTEGGDPQMADMEATLGDEPQEPQDETTEDETTDAPKD